MHTPMPHRKELAELQEQCIRLEAKLDMLLDLFFPEKRLRRKEDNINDYMNELLQHHGKKAEKRA